MEAYGIYRDEEWSGWIRIKGQPDDQTKAVDWRAKSQEGSGELWCKFGVYWPLGPQHFWNFKHDTRKTRADLYNHVKLSQSVAQPYAPRKTRSQRSKFRLKNIPNHTVVGALKKWSQASKPFSRPSCEMTQLSIQVTSHFALFSWWMAVFSHMVATVKLRAGPPATIPS